MVTFVLTVFVAALSVPLSEPLISLIFERQAFDARARELVSSMFSIYICGGFFYVARDLIVRVFYILGDGIVPFRVSVLTVLVNGCLNWFFTWYLSLGPQGIVLSTVTTSIVSVMVLLRSLGNKIGPSERKGKALEIFKVSAAGLVAAQMTMQSHSALSQLPLLGILENAAVLALSALCGAGAFIALLLLLRVENPL